MVFSFRTFKRSSFLMLISESFSTLGVNVKRAVFRRLLPPEALIFYPLPADPSELLGLLGVPIGHSTHSIGVGPVEIRATFFPKQFWAAGNLFFAAQRAFGLPKGSQLIFLRGKACHKSSGQAAECTTGGLVEF